MAENLQTTRPAEEGWTTVIRPKTGWFDIDLNELWRYRDLITMFVKRNFTVLYKQTILGPAWIILNPLITTIIFNVVFGGMANMPTDGVPGFLFYMAGNTVWTFFANCVSRARLLSFGCFTQCRKSCFFSSPSSLPSGSPEASINCCPVIASSRSLNGVPSTSIVSYSARQSCAI